MSPDDRFASGVFASRMIERTHSGWTSYFGGSSTGFGIALENVAAGDGLPIRPVTERRPKVTPKTPESSMKDWQEEEIDGGTVKKHH